MLGRCIAAGGREECDSSLDRAPGAVSASQYDGGKDDDELT